MSKHCTAMIHGHSTLKKSSRILHITLLHCFLCIGEDATISCFICAPQTVLVICARFTCSVSVHFSVNDNVSEQLENRSMCLH